MTVNHQKTPNPSFLWIDKTPHSSLVIKKIFDFTLINQLGFIL